MVVQSLATALIVVPCLRRTAIDSQQTAKTQVSISSVREAAAQGESVASCQLKKRTRLGYFLQPRHYQQAGKISLPEMMLQNVSIVN
jgi:hypothetical protein